MNATIWTLLLTRQKWWGKRIQREENQSAYGYKGNDNVRMNLSFPTLNVVLISLYLGSQILWLKEPNSTFFFFTFWHLFFFKFLKM